MLQPIKIILAPLLLSLLLVVTACGSDSNDRDPDGTGEGSTGGSDDGSGGTDPGSGGTDPGTGGSDSTCSAEGKECDQGFECDDSGDEIDCVDIDECAEETDDCDADSYCVNSEGSFSCEACPAGYELDDEDCVDVDECATETDTCDENATCENTDGAYECTCDDGFEGDGEACSDLDECEEGLAECDEALVCVNNFGSFSCEPCPGGYELDGDECVALVPHVLSSNPAQGAEDVYPSEFFVELGFGIRERVSVRLTFDMEMNTNEATIVVTDEAGLEEPRAIEGTWDETGHILSAIILPLDEGSSYPALLDETTYNVSFGDLQNSFGTPVNLDDPVYPEAMLTFTTGVRDALINHACIHVQYGPFSDVTALATPQIWAPNVDMAHYHYTIAMPAGSDVGYTSYFPVATGFFRLYASGDEDLQLETSIIDWDTLEPGPWTAVDLEVAPAACYTVGADVGITHQFTLHLDDENFYMLRWTTSEDTVRTIVEYAGEEL